MCRAIWWALVLPLAMPVCGAAVVADQQTKATIVIPPRANPQRRGSACLLQTYIARGTGVRIPIVDRPGEGLALHVGRSAYVDSLDLALDALDADGFVLKLVDGRNYVIAGPDEWGTEFGVCEFLERYLGVRWLLPGENGTDVPRRDFLELSTEEVRQEPVYWSRQLSGLRGESQLTWARRNRMHARVNMHHNMTSLFPPERYARTHSHFYPVIDGTRYIPRSRGNYNWQPNFSAEGIVEEAVKNIKHYFRAHPEEMSYSLGVNDSSRFDESPESLARDTRKQNLFGLRDASESYYRWCNQVVAEVLKEFPDKYFGCLAYVNVAEPPRGIRLHPHIIPFLPHDRMMWIDPKVEAAGHELTARWAACARTLGWYDYANGTPYCLPRVYMHHMAEYLRYGHDQGVQAHYAALYPNWGEGPKAYVYLKLQWNPDLDVDALLEEWYTRCVGSEAAALLEEYYDIWERFWTVDVLRSPWFSGQGHYLRSTVPSYLAAVREDDVRRSRELLDACVARAARPDQRARAELLRSAFEYYEASALAYGAGVVTRQGPLATEAQAGTALDDAVARLEMAQRRIEFTQRYRGHYFLDMPIGLDDQVWLRGADWGVGLFWRLYGWAERSPAIRASIAALGGHECGRVRQQARMLALLLDGPGERLSENPSFEEDGVSPWKLWVKYGVGSLRLVSDQARTGSHSILCDGMRRGGPNQTVPIRPGRYVAIGYAYVPEGQTVLGTAAIVAVMRGDDDANITTSRTELIPAPGRWTPLVFPIEVPETVGSKRITRLLLGVTVDGWEDGDLYLDDIALYRFPG